MLISNSFSFIKRIYFSNLQKVAKNVAHGQNQKEPTEERIYESILTDLAKQNC